MIKAKQLNYHVNSSKVLDDINIEIASGKVTSILGPNGAGKTTLLKCLSGTINNYTGFVQYNNRDINDYSLSELSRFRAVLSQSNPVNFPFTVLEVVLMGRNPYERNSRPNKDKQIANEALALVDASHLKERILPTLSGGEQQRVQLARVITQIWERKDAILFLDEPTSALDLKHQHKILQLANKLAKINNVSVICILHDLNLASHYTDYTILMSEGCLYKYGETNQIITSKNIEKVYQLPEKMVRKFHFNLSHLTS